MKLNKKLEIDRKLGGIAITLITPFSRLIEKKSKEKTIVITKIVGIGSIIQATPLMEKIKNEMPNTKIVLITTKGNKTLAELTTPIDEVITIEDKNIFTLFKTTVKAILKIRKLKPSTHIDLEVYSKFSSVISILGGAPRKIGFYRHTPKQKEKVYTDLIFFNTKKQVREIYLKTVDIITNTPSNKHPKLPQIKTTQEEIEEFDKLRKTLNIPKEYIAINTNASDLLLERKWPEEKFVELMDVLASKGKYMVLTGSKNERDSVNKIENKVKDENKKFVINTAGLTSPHSFIGTLRNASCIVTNDTGPMHLGAALGTKVVSIWGPGDPTHYGFHTEENVIIIKEDTFCSPCIYEVEPPPCRGNNVCMKKISVEKVIKSIENTNVKSTDTNTSSSNITQPIEEIIEGVYKRQEKCIVCGDLTTVIGTVGSHPLHKCEECGIQFLSPQPTNKELEEIYTGEYYNSWGSSKNEEDTREAKKFLFREYLKNHEITLKGKKVLDLGAATGYFMEVVKEEGGHPYGLDINPSAVESLKSKFGNSSIYDKEVETMKLDTTFDIITMFDYIEHVRNPEVVIKQCRKYLNKGGIIIGTTPHSESISRKILMSGWFHYKPEHLFYYSVKSLKKIAEKAGMKLELAENNKKVLPIDYITSILITYKVKLLGNISKFIQENLSEKVKQKKVKLPSGELFFILKNE